MQLEIVNKIVNKIFYYVQPSVQVIYSQIVTTITFAKLHTVQLVHLYRVILFDKRRNRIAICFSCESLTSERRCSATNQLSTSLHDLPVSQNKAIAKFNYLSSSTRNFYTHITSRGHPEQSLGKIRFPHICRHQVSLV